MKTYLTADQFDVVLYSDRYIEAVKSSLGDNLKITSHHDTSDVDHVADVWDAIFVLSDRETLRTLIDAAAFLGGGIAAGALNEVGKALYEKAKNLVFACHRTHREKCIRTRANDPDRDGESLRYGIRLTFGEKKAKGTGFNIYFRVPSLDSEDSIIDKEIDANRTASMIGAFEAIIAPRVSRILERFPNAEITIELETQGRHPANCHLFIFDGNAKAVGSLDFSPSYTIQSLDANSEELRRLLG